MRFCLWDGEVWESLKIIFFLEHGELHWNFNINVKIDVSNKGSFNQKIEILTVLLTRGVSIIKKLFQFAKKRKNRKFIHQTPFKNFPSLPLAPTSKNKFQSKIAVDLKIKILKFMQKPSI